MHIHIARVLRSYGLHRPQHASEICPAFQQLCKNWHQKCQRFSRTWVRDGQRWSEAGSAKSKANPMQRGYFHQIIVLGQLWLFVLLPVFAMPIKSRPAAAQQSSNRSSAAASIHERSLCKSSKARSKVGKVTPSIIKIYKVMFTSIAYSNDF